MSIIDLLISIRKPHVMRSLKGIRRGRCAGAPDSAAHSLAPRSINIYEAGFELEWLGNVRPNLRYLLGFLDDDGCIYGGDGPSKDKGASSAALVRLSSFVE